jgi:hypothetical protein
MSFFKAIAPVTWLFFSIAASGSSVAATDAADGPKSREQVKAELAAEVGSGTFRSMTRNRSYPPDFDPAWHAGRGAAVSNLRGSGQIEFAAPAAGPRSRQDVLLELQRAREDGSLRRLNSDREY